MLLLFGRTAHPFSLLAASFPSPIAFYTELGMVPTQFVLFELELFNYVASEFFTALLLPALKHLQVFFQSPLHLVKVLLELRIQTADLRLPSHH